MMRHGAPRRRCLQIDGRLGCLAAWRPQELLLTCLPPASCLLPPAASAASQQPLAASHHWLAGWLAGCWLDDGWLRLVAVGWQCMAGWTLDWLAGAWLPACWLGGWLGGCWVGGRYYNAPVLSRRPQPPASLAPPGWLAVRPASQPAGRAAASTAGRLWCCGGAARATEAFPRAHGGASGRGRRASRPCRRAARQVGAA